MKTTISQKLAAYATIKGMADSAKYKNNYYILAEFIKYIIVSNSLFEFSVFEIISLLKEEFDFDIPYAVAKSGLARVDGLQRERDDYKEQWGLTPLRNC